MNEDQTILLHGGKFKMTKRRNYSGFYNPNKKETTAPKEVTTDIPKAEPVKVVSEPIEVPKQELAKAIVSGANLVYMRMNPSKEGKPIDKLAEGTEVTIGDSKILGPDWSHISYNGKTGFMMSKYLKRI